MLNTKPIESMRSLQARHARNVLDACGGDKKQACRVLGISHHTLKAYLHRRPEGGRVTPRMLVAEVVSQVGKLRERAALDDALTPEDCDLLKLALAEVCDTFKGLALATQQVDTETAS
jgi:hypothetical protein